MILSSYFRNIQIITKSQPCMALLFPVLKLSYSSKDTLYVLDTLVAKNLEIYRTCHQPLHNANYIIVQLAHEGSVKSWAPVGN